MTDIGERDERGRYLPGTSGNPYGRPPGRSPRALNALADEALGAVLAHDLRIVRDRNAEPRACKEALDRLVRLGARRISTQTPEPLDDTADLIVEIITRRVTDPDLRRAIADDLAEALEAREDADGDTTVSSY